MAPFHPISSPPRPHQSPSQQLSTYTQYQSLLDPSNAIASGSGTGRDKEKERDFMGMDPPDRLKRIRRLVLTEGIPEIPNQPSLRPIIWKLLLQIDTHLETGDYLRLVGMGPSSLSLKIKNDTFRTLATDPQFKSVVSDEMLERLLECFVWRSGGGGDVGSGGSGGEKDGQEFGEDAKDPSQITYVQGMNVLSAPLLYVLPSQLEAYECFRRLIEGWMPGYCGMMLGGVHRGLKLLDKCLQAVDEELFLHLKSKNLSAELYAFPSVLTLSACTPPLNEVLKLWDFLLAFGVHLNVLCVIAQMLLMRQELMDSTSPMKLLRIFPPLDAQAVIGITVALVKDVPEELYGELVRHPLLA